MKKIIVFLLLILFPVSVWAEDDGPAELDELNSYEKTPIEQVAFEKEGRKLNGYSAPGALITTDFGESMEVPESGEFSFEVPKDIQMVIINAINQEGLEPNSIMFNLSENRLLSDGEETPPPNAPNIKEKKQEKKENQKPKEKKEEIKEKKKETSNTEKKEEPSSTEKKDQTTISQKKTIQTESTDISIEEVPNQTKSNENFWRWVKISLFLLLIIAVVAVILSGKLIKVKTSKKKKRKTSSKKKKKNKRKKRKNVQ